MRFTLYTDKTTAQCLSAINGRLQAKETASRPALDGWIDRNGEFSLKVTRPVIGKFARTTRLKGHLERESGVTVVRGVVPGGSSKRERIIALIALAVLGALIGLAGRPLLALLLVPVGFWLYIPMAGDYENGPLLLLEVQRALKAKSTPPKPAKGAANNGKSAASTRPITKATTQAGPKPAGARPAPKPVPPPRPAPDDEDEAEVYSVDEDAQPRLI